MERGRAAIDIGIRVSTRRDLLPVSAFVRRARDLLPRMTVCNEVAIRRPDDVHALDHCRRGHFGTTAGLRQVIEKAIIARC